MMRLVLAAVTALSMVSTPSTAQDRVTLGWGRFFSNDALGDGQDRWRTGSYAISRVRGADWTGALPDRFGEILEFRLRADTIAPENLEDPAANDRRYAGLITLGLHSQLAFSGFEANVGADLGIVGPQTGIGRFQSWVHDTMGLGEIAALDTQIDDAVYLTVSGEIARRFALGDRVELRPYVAAQAGIETLVRVGGDIVIGDFGRDDLMLRDSTTGHRYRGVEGARVTGVSIMLGADLAQVFGSALLPDSGATELSDTRHRLRAGVHWQGQKASAFYGLTYLSKEFEQQDEGQFVGALNLNIRF